MLVWVKEPSAYPILNALHELEFRQTLIDELPKLESAGGFELMRCIPNTHQLEPISSTVSHQPKLLKSVVANGRIYIRPIQKDLDLSPVGDMDEVIIQLV